MISIHAHRGRGADLTQPTQISDHPLGVDVRPITQPTQISTDRGRGGRDPAHPAEAVDVITTTAEAVITLSVLPNQCPSLSSDC